MDSVSLYPGDCLAADTGISRLGPASVDLLLTDLPYESTRQKWDTRLDLVKMWDQLETVVKPNGVFLFFCDLPLGLDLVKLRPDWYRYEYVWVKNKTTGFFNVNRMPLRGHEFILVFYRETPWYESIKSQGHSPLNYAKRLPNASAQIYGTDKGAVYGGNTDRHPSSVLCFDVVNNDSPDRIHSNQKPDLLLRHLIRSHCPPGGRVLDICAGSGATLVAAEGCNREAIGWEGDPENFQRAQAWLAVKRAQMASLLPGLMEDATPGATAPKQPEFPL